MTADEQLTHIQMGSQESEFSYEDFVRSRILYWMKEAKSLEKLPTAEKLELTEESSHFFISAAGPGSAHGVLEDSHETGWFYLYDSAHRSFVKAIPVYNRQELEVEAEDVDVAWSTNGGVCCVAVWGQMRAFLGLTEDLEMYQLISERNADGFYANECPEGFSYLLKKMTTKDQKR